METKKDAKKVAALMQRLEADFGDVNLDLKMLGLDDAKENAVELLEISEEMENRKPPLSDGEKPDTYSHSEAIALMARLGSQFGDLDMSHLGFALGIDPVSGGGVGETDDKGDSHQKDEFQSDDSSLEDPTPEELEVWQASQFKKGREQKQQSARDSATNMKDSTTCIRQRRKLLREKRDEQLVKEQMRIRLGCQSQLLEGREAESFSRGNLDVLDGESSTFFSSSGTQLLDELVSNECNGDPEILQTSWKRLYASYEQGLGFWNLWNALMGYDGPTMMILRTVPSASKHVTGPGPKIYNTNQTGCIGFYTTTPWVENSDFFGGDTSTRDADRAFLFSINEPSTSTTNYTETSTGENVQFFPVQTKEEGGRYMYCRPSKMSKGQGANESTNKSFAVNGIGVGGRPTQPRFHLTESFEDCRCLTYDSSRVTRDGDLFDFGNRSEDRENGATHPFAQALYYFDVEDIEVWGVGGSEWIEHALKERDGARKERIQRFQTVDKQMMWDQGVFSKRMASSGVKEQ